MATDSDSVPRLREALSRLVIACVATGIVLSVLARHDRASAQDTWVAPAPHSALVAVVEFDRLLTVTTEDACVTNASARFSGPSSIRVSARCGNPESAPESFHESDLVPFDSASAASTYFDPPRASDPKSARDMPWRWVLIAALAMTATAGGVLYHRYREGSGRTERVPGIESELAERGQRESRQLLGTVLIGIGLVFLAGAAIASSIVDDGDQTVLESADGADDAIALNEGAPTTPPTGAPSTTQTSTSTPAITVAPSTTQSRTTTTSTTTTTTTTAAPTTSSLAPEVAIAAFVDEFSAAIELGDVDWLLEHLNGSMILGYGETVCRSFIEDEILLLKEYELTGSIRGPVTKNLSTGLGEVSVGNIYTAGTRFVFRGSPFDALADFVIEESITWLGTCR